MELPSARVIDIAAGVALAIPCLPTVIVDLIGGMAMRTWLAVRFLKYVGDPDGEIFQCMDADQARLVFSQFEWSRLRRPGHLSFFPSLPGTHPPIIAQDIPAGDLLANLYMRGQAITTYTAPSAPAMPCISVLWRYLRASAQRRRPRRRPLF